MSVAIPIPRHEPTNLVTLPSIRDQNPRPLRRRGTVVLTARPQTARRLAAQHPRCMVRKPTAGIPTTMLRDPTSTVAKPFVKRYVGIVVRVDQQLQKNKAKARARYKADPEKKKASVRDTYNANAVSKRAAKRQRYQEGVEENRAAKRQRYQEGVEENRAANRRIYRGNSATIKTARRSRYWKGRRTTTTTQSETDLKTLVLDVQKTVSTRDSLIH
ncbi:hypothetical protein EMCRGX_G009628 [Ephydatia muelleri]